MASAMSCAAFAISLSRDFLSLSHRELPHPKSCPSRVSHIQSSSGLREVEMLAQGYTSLAGLCSPRASDSQLRLPGWASIKLDSSSYPILLLPPLFQAFTPGNSPIHIPTINTVSECASNRTEHTTLINKYHRHY